LLQSLRCVATLAALRGTIVVRRVNALRARRQREYRVRIIGVLDLAGGLAVHARAGRREDYAPVQRVAAASIPAGDAIALATAYRDRLGIQELYVADLDAIVAGRPQPALVSALARVSPLWLDAGITSVGGAREAIANGASRVVIGLETLSSFEALEQICRTVGTERVAFSLDMRDGRPIGRLPAVPPDATAIETATHAAGSGVGTMIVLDLARVGMGRGLDLDVIARLRAAVPDVTLIAGGGIRGLADLSRLAKAGGDGALVATALQDGALTAREIAAARQLQPSVSR
jgi:phosphoribosylformimino-5-aminoimidazole carboxamide ribotide isomerase